MTNEYRLADSVLHQIVQIIQEGFLTGTDISDHMRMIRLEDDPKHSGVLLMTPAYKVQVELNRKKLLDFADEQMKMRVAQDADDQP